MVSALNGIFSLIKDGIKGEISSLKGDASAYITRKGMQDATDRQNMLADEKARMTDSKSMHKYANSCADEFNRMIN